jgi:hypothetical protein
MPRLRALLILLLASCVLLGTDRLLRQQARTGGTHGRKRRITFMLIPNKTAARQCGVDIPVSLLGRASEVLE